jgi:hypothetical protein
LLDAYPGQEPGQTTSGRILSGILLILIVYCAVMTLPLFVVGMFVGPVILCAAVVHALLSAGLICTRRALLQGKRWARWALVLLSIAGVMALPAMWIELPEGERRLGSHLTFPSIISLVGLTVLILTVLSAGHSWHGRASGRTR